MHKNPETKNITAQWQGFLKTMLWLPLVTATATQAQEPVRNLALNRAAEEKPNIVFILANELGYGDPGCFGATKIRTPHIDRLAREAGQAKWFPQRNAAPLRGEKCDN